MNNRTLHALSAAGLSLALSACTQPPAPTAMQQPAPPPPVLASAGCNAQPAQGALGKAASDALLEQARREAGAQTARFLRPGQEISKEGNLQRLNLSLDAADKVIRVHCG